MTQRMIWHPQPLIPLKFIGSFKVLECIGKVANWLTLLVSINYIHNMFHVSLLHKYINMPTHVFKVIEDKLEDNLMYEKCLV